MNSDFHQSIRANLCPSVVLCSFFGCQSQRENDRRFLIFIRTYETFLGVLEFYDRRFWPKNNGAKVRVCHRGPFLESFLHFLEVFLQKVGCFLRKSGEMERFLTILKKTGSFSR